MFHSAAPHCGKYEAFIWVEQDSNTVIDEKHWRHKKSTTYSTIRFAGDSTRQTLVEF